MKYVKSIEFNTCKNLFFFKNKNNKLEQQKRLEQFVYDNNITDLHKVFINQGYHSLNELGSTLIKESKQAKEFLYIAVNKFLIYSTTDNDYFREIEDYDLRLIRFCEAQLKENFVLVDYHVDSNDHGTVGNFVHPVTNLFLRRYA